VVRRVDPPHVRDVTGTAGFLAYVSAMSNDGVVTRYAEAWANNDIEAVMAAYAPDFVAHYGGRSPFAGTHHGKDEFLRVLITTTARSRRQLDTIEAVFDDGDRGAIFVREGISVNGETHVVARALRYRVANGQLVECWLYDQDQHLVDAAWSQPDPT
jgi:ketosteroid isomerase-like protein